LITSRQCCASFQRGSLFDATLQACVALQLVMQGERVPYTTGQIAKPSRF
jgi:hypothetical protein